MLDRGLGRFISSDPVGFEGGVNHYSYAPSATNWIDPLGLAKRKPPNTADWELRDSKGRIKTRGCSVSGGTSPGRRLSFPEQQKVHTEGKILAATKGKTKAGDILTIRGREAPCPMCGPAMKRAAKERGIKIVYTDSHGVKRVYPPK